jgi:hypothetical protein
MTFASGAKGQRFESSRAYHLKNVRPGDMGNRMYRLDAINGGSPKP